MLTGKIDPKTEAFDMLGWAAGNQETFRPEYVRKTKREYYLANMRADVVAWWRAVQDTKESASFWSGLGDAGECFRKFYENVECCGTGSPLYTFRKQIERLPTFEERREALFRIVLLENPGTSAGWKDTPPTEGDVDRILNRVTGKEKSK